VQRCGDKGENKGTSRQAENEFRKQMEKQCPCHKDCDIIGAFEHWHIFLEGNKETVTVFTDHRNLEYWKASRTFNCRHSCWYLTLAPYNFVIMNRPGKQSHKPDALSRRADHMQLVPEEQVMLPNSRF
jgi:hypothetical protein